MNRSIRSLSILAAAAALTATAGASAEGASDPVTEVTPTGMLTDSWFSLSMTRGPNDDGTVNDGDPDHDHGNGNDDDTPPAEPTPPPADPTPPADDTTPPADDTTPPADDTTPPADDTTPPADDDTPDTTDPVDSITDPMSIPEIIGASTSAGDTAAEIKETVQEIVPAAAPAPTWSMPVQGENFVVGVLEGHVRVRRPRGQRSGELTGIENVPVGSRLDTRAGAVVLVSALPGGHYQAATFKEGRFDAVQTRKGSGVVDLILRGKTGCGGNGEADPLLAQSSAKKNAKGRRLWATDDNGQFRTHGRDSVATVRGTEWITEDTCEGTRTTVVKGAVQVRDLHTGRKTLVRAGQSHLVRTR